MVPYGQRFSPPPGIKSVTCDGLVPGADLQLTVRTCSHTTFDPGFHSLVGQGLVSSGRQGIVGHRLEAKRHHRVQTPAKYNMLGQGSKIGSYHSEIGT